MKYFRKSKLGVYTQWSERELALNLVFTVNSKDLFVLFFVLHIMPSLVCIIAHQIKSHNENICFAVVKTNTILRKKQLNHKHTYNNYKKHAKEITLRYPNVLKIYILT